MKKKQLKKGFTLIELVIVIAVIAILAAVLIPTFASVISNSKKSAALQEAKAAQTVFATETVEHFTGSTYYIETKDGYWFSVDATNALTALEKAKPTEAETGVYIIKTATIADLSANVTIYLKGNEDNKTFVEKAKTDGGWELKLTPATT